MVNVHLESNAHYKMAHVSSTSDNLFNVQFIEATNTDIYRPLNSLFAVIVTIKLNWCVLPHWVV